MRQKRLHIFVSANKNGPRSESHINYKIHYLHEFDDFDEKQTTSPQTNIA
jgi:hypothetical protein